MRSRVSVLRSDGKMDGMVVCVQGGGGESKQ